MTACPGLAGCNRRYWRAEALHKAALAKYAADIAAIAAGALVLGDGDAVPERPEPHTIRPVAGEPVWCGECANKINLMFAELDDLAGQLAMLPPGVKPAVNLRREQEKVRASRSPRSPSPGGDTLTEYQAWLRHYERTYCLYQRWPQPTRTGMLATVRTSTWAFIGTHLAGLLTTQHAEPFGMEVADWHGELKAATHADAVEHFVPQPCPKPPRGCGRFMLWQKPGDEMIRCKNPNCNAVLTREELEDATARQRRA